MSFRFWILFIFLLSSQQLFAQQIEDPIIEEVIETVVANQVENYDYSELIERLNQYKKNKLNLNKASIEDLQSLIFLNPLQINNLREHIAENGKLIDVLELQSIEGFDLETIHRLLYFANISAPSGFENFSFQKLFRDGKNDLIIRYNRYLETQKGFQVPASSGKSRYLGTPERVLMRYRFSFSNNIQFSLNLEKDAGEKYWQNTHGQSGPDFLSASLYIKDFKRFRKIALGDYSLQFGQGLTLWSGLGFGKGANIYSVAKQDLGLRPYTSVNEFSFFRGIASQINFGDFDFTPFISFNKLDAGIALNSLTNLEDISALQQTGLHRTPNELANRRRISQWIAGGNLQYNHKKLSLGLTAYHSQYSQKFAPGKYLYNQFEFSGDRLTNVGINYSYTLHNTYFYGELAHRLNSGIALVSGLMSSLSPMLSTVFFYRNYQKDYFSFYNQGIGEGSNAVNEKGFYGGLELKPNRKFSLNFYTDLFKFPWLKFGVDAPSAGYDIFGQFNFTPNKTTRYTLRYQFQNKQINAINQQVTNVLGFEKKSNYRAEVQYAVNKSFSLRNRLEMVQFNQEDVKSKFGFLAYQDINYSPLSSRWSGNLRFVLFDTEGFDTRIYTYESDVLYGFSIPAFQNQGIRWYSNIRYRVKKGVDIWLRYGYTQYNNVSSIGSGLDEISGNHRSEAKVQLRFQF